MASCQALSDVYKRHECRKWGAANCDGVLVRKVEWEQENLDLELYLTMTLLGDDLSASQVCGEDKGDGGTRYATLRPELPRVRYEFNNSNRQTSKL